MEQTSNKFDQRIPNALLLGCLPHVRVQRYRHEVKTVEVEACMAMAMVCNAMDRQWQAAHNGACYGWWLRLFQVRAMNKWHS